MTGRVVVVGSINADWIVEVPRLPAGGQTVVGDRVEHRHGGKGANQAVAAALAGAEGEDGGRRRRRSSWPPVSSPRSQRRGSITRACCT